jgi:hypothetical protein
MLMCNFVLKRGNSTIFLWLFLDRESGCCLKRLDRAFVVLFGMFIHGELLFCNFHCTFILSTCWVVHLCTFFIIWVNV